MEIQWNSMVETLIKAVKDRPFLYDSKHPDYKHHVKKMKAWNEITKEIGGGSPSVIKEKWKNLRDTYRRQRLIEVSEQIQSHWLWLSQMSFLEPTMDLRRRSIYKTLANNNLLESKTRKLSKRKSVKDYDKDYEKHRTKVKSESEGLDNVDHLFLSYAHTFKGLSKREQASLKLELAQIFTAAELRDLDKEETQKYSVSCSVENCAQPSSIQFVDDRSDCDPLDDDDVTEVIDAVIEFKQE